MSSTGSRKSWSITTTITREADKKLIEIAKRRYTTRSELLRRLIDDFLRKEENDRTQIKS